MRVKRLEIQGFKSFKDKTVIHFDHGITGIVGPNGCGKSNIVDAFFWVMGEQSYKHMRGTSSDDLIFNGSSKYSPLGMAEATLVLETGAVIDTENTPSGAVSQESAKDIPIHLRAKEVSVTRRLYRSGEGEYFINGVPARLKDIHELFMDTGVGAKGYSVIEQGQIGKIVNAKPEDRRLLIEEAAGIAKYKARKKESLRKMEATQLNLSRLNDVVQEIERSLGSLERQAQKARQYKKYKEELLDKEMTWGRRKTLVIRQRLETLRADKETFEQELIALRAELQMAENTIEVDRIDQVTDTKAAEEIQTQIQNLSDDLAREKGALELSHRRQNDLQSQLQSLEQEKTDLQTSLDEETYRLEQRSTEVTETETAFQSAVQQAQQMDANVREIRQAAETSRKNLDEAKRKLMQSIQETSSLTSRAASLASRIESARAQAEKFAQELEIQNVKIVEAREESEKSQLAYEDLKQKRESTQALKNDAASKLRDQEQISRQKTRERDDSHRSLTQLKSKLQSLEELASAYEGFGDGPKAALEFVKSKSAESVSALADALEIDAEYESALGGWLENRLENLVSREPSLALEALEKIRTDRQGRAAIHVSTGGAVDTYNSIRFDQIQSLLESEGFEVVGELSAFARINKSLPSNVQQIASRAVALVAVVKTMAPLTKLIDGSNCSRLGHWSIVSLDGIALDQSGILHGGSVENDGAASVLRRKRAIQELSVQVVEAEALHLNQEVLTLETQQNLEAAQTQLQVLQSDLQALEIQSAAMERDVQQGLRSLRDAESLARGIESEVQENQEEITAATEERESMQAQVAEIEGSRADLEARISEGETDLHQRDLDVRAQEVELQTLKVNEASLKERVQSLKREMETSKVVIADRERRLNEINRTLERATDEQEQFCGGESDLQTKIEELTLILATHKENLAVIKDRMEQSSAELNGALEKIKELHKSVDHKSTSSNQIALELEKLSSDLSHLVQNLEEKYGPGCLEKPAVSPIQEEMTDPVVTAEMSAEEETLLGEDVERLRERIRRLGEVNVMAIDEYEELKKRYDHLLSEKGDLEHSIKNLEDAIEHINKTSEDRFRRAFDAISDRFQRLFPVIFGGGSAQITLVYPEGSNDILEAGVDILAQPPGKKVSNITLLSGGEKALTAVSLIFAIFMVKPSPFCVLDEVDAPLDDANIGKFNALLREMSVKSQFILITHNKKTMELNDTLYGVTMEEPGVSKMVSIELH
jgi:chromosome segregation protein